jgi:hypothetical protein
VSLNLSPLSLNLNPRPLMVAVKVNPKWPMMSRPSDYDFTPLQLATFAAFKKLPTTQARP